MVVGGGNLLVFWFILWLMLLVIAFIGGLIYVANFSPNVYRL